MNMNFLFAWRYFKSKKTTNAINVISWISVLAIAVGTAALIIVLSVFNGFENLVKNLYSDFYSDIRIAPRQGKFTVFDSDFVSRLNKVPGVAHYSFVAEEKAVLVNGDYQSIVFLKGIDSAYLQVNELDKHMLQGKFEVGNTDEPRIVAGVGIAGAVGADPESPISDLVLYLPNRKAKNFNNLDAMHSYNVNTAGIFAVQDEFDDKYVFTNLPFMQYMLDMQPDEFSSIELDVKEGADEMTVKADLQKLAGNNFTVQTRYEQNQSLFTVMQIEKWVIYAILSLILSVAAFNMIGALTMLVLEKEKDIAVLKAMGADARRIQTIFLGEGFLLAGLGGLAGMTIAFTICWLQINFHLIKLQGGTFIIDYYPVKMVGFDFLLVTATIVLVALFASWIPARKASTQFFSLKS